MPRTPESLQASFQSTLEERAGEPMLSFYDRHGEFRWMNGEEMSGRGASAANELREAGLGRGDVCIIVLPSGPASAFALTGALMIGALPLLIAPPSLQKFNSDLTRIFERMVQKTKARVVVQDDSLATDTRLPGGAKRIVTNGEAMPEPASDSIAWALPKRDDIAALQLTSGTTGFPRICMWKHKGVLAALEGMTRAMDLRDDDVFFNWTPLYHDMGLVNNFFTCLWRGLPMVIQNPNDFVKHPASWLRGLAETGSTVAWSPNFGYALAAERVKDRQLEGVRLDGVRQFWNAAERIHYESMVAFHRRFEPFGVTWESLKTNFGCAENVGGATFSDPNGPMVVERIDRATFQSKGEAVPASDTASKDGVMTVVSAGRPHPLMQVKVVSPRGKTLPEGHVGELAMKTPSRLEGFLGDAASSRRAHLGEYLRRGDLAYLRGDEVFWVGRVRERIVVRGKKYDPSDFERALLDIPGLRKGCFAAFGVDDPERVCEAREPMEQNRKDLIAEVRERIYQQLDLAVNDVVLVKAGTLTKTSSGKRRHRNFSRMYREGKLAEWAIEDAA